MLELMEKYTTGSAGENNHTYDVGYISCNTTLTGGTVCIGKTITLTGSGTPRHSLFLVTLVEHNQWVL